jgi:hypothetical protein
MYKPRPITLTERELRVLGAMERALADEDPAAVPIAVHFGATRVIYLGLVVTLCSSTMAVSCRCGGVGGLWPVE